RSAESSRIDIIDNCSGPKDAQGRCQNYCQWNSPTTPAIRGRHQTQRNTGSSQAVWLIDSPGSRIAESSLCSGGTEQSYAVRMDGDAAGTEIRSSHISAFAGAQFTHVIHSTGCGGASPRIADNFTIIGETSSNFGAAHGIHVEGDCHPVIDNNLRIAGGGEGPNAPLVVGVYCGALNGV